MTIRKLINLKRGFPAESLLRYSSEKILKQNAVEMWDESTPMKILPYIDNLGLKSLRADIVRMFNMESWGDASSKKNNQTTSSNIISDPVLNQVMISHGCSQGIYHLLTHLRKGLKDPVCIVEEPSYFIMPSVIEEAAWSVDGVPMQSDGLDLDALEEKIRKYDGRVKAVYTIPIHQNPTGITLSDEKRMRLIKLSREYDFYIFADEVYQLLGFENQKTMPLAYFDEEYDRVHKDNTQGKVFSIGSFSKIIAPGIKLGYILSSKSNRIFKELDIEGGVLHSCGGNNGYMSGLVHYSFSNGTFEENLIHVRKEYQERMEALVHALQKYGSQYFEFKKPSGGYFVWVKLNLNSNGDETTIEQMDDFIKQCEEEQLLLIRGDQCSFSRMYHNYLRICFGWNEIEDLEEGVQRLVKVASALRR